MLITRDESFQRILALCKRATPVSANPARAVLGMNQLSERDKEALELLYDPGAQHTPVRLASGVQFTFWKGAILLWMMDDPKLAAQALAELN